MASGGRAERWVSRSRTHNKQNEITAVSGATSPTYDASGNLTTDETGRQFVYDAWNRLVKVKDSGGTVLETLGYDVLNQRVSVTTSTATTDLYYSSDWQVLEVRVGGVAAKQYVWSPVGVDVLVERDRDTDANGSLDERLYVLQDANDNVTALVNTSGAVVERFVYDPYGAVAVLDAGWGARSGSAYDWTVLWQGQHWDGVSGLYWFREGGYSPTLGRDVNSHNYQFVLIGSNGDKTWAEEGFDAINLPGAILDWWWTPGEAEMRRPVHVPRPEWDISNTKNRCDLPAAGTDGKESVKTNEQRAGEYVIKGGKTIFVLAGVVIVSQVIDKAGFRITTIGGATKRLPRAVRESRSVVDASASLTTKQFESYWRTLQNIAIDAAGKNQHRLTGDLAGYFAFDIPGSGRGRGLLRAVYRIVDGVVEVVSIQDYH